MTPNLTRALGGLLAAFTLGIPMVSAHAQTYPDHPIKLSVGFPAGTGPDISSMRRYAWVKFLVQTT